ncbi:hypothetical protein D3C85_1091180 [compost metagenome]
MKRNVRPCRPVSLARGDHLANLLLVFVVNGLGVHAVDESQHSITFLGFNQEFVFLDFGNLAQFDHDQAQHAADVCQLPVVNALGAVDGHARSKAHLGHCFSRQARLSAWVVDQQAKAADLDNLSQCQFGDLVERQAGSVSVL